MLSRLSQLIGYLPISQNENDFRGYLLIDTYLESNNATQAQGTASRQRRCRDQVGFCDRGVPGRYLTGNRKLRNRVSQQAFRRRQSEYIKQLERKAKAYKPDNERIIELEEENTSLRESLIQCHTKLESLRTTICTLSEGIARTLDDPVRSLSVHPTMSADLITFLGPIYRGFP